jgi:DNA (cytosine-5)-methyltransferase 1
MTCKWQVEIDGYATRVLEKHWPDVWRWRDVTTFLTDSVRTECEPGTGRRRVWQGDQELTVDLVAGGFPCQDISYAGKGAGIKGKRSGLFFEAARVVGLLRPRYVLLENVAALLNRGMVDVLGTLASFGYDAEWHCIQAADFGAPHIRDRVFIIAYRQSERCGEGWARGATGAGTGEKNEAEMANANDAGSRASRSCTNGMQSSKKNTKQSQPFIELSGFSEANRSGWWSAEPDVGRVADGIPSRMDRLRGLGNAVVCQISEFIAKEVIKHDQSN